MNCCYGCDKRCVGCHSTCKDYLNYKSDMENIREKKNKYAEVNQFYREQSAKIKNGCGL